MKNLIKVLKNTKVGYTIRRNPLLKSSVKSIYKIIMFPFTRKGIDVSIGGTGCYRLDYNFAFSEYESFGDRHNAGFRKWIECCKNKAVIFDVGAHIGLYTLPASKAIAPGGTVYAFEPSEANRRYLKRHLEYNKIYNVILSPYIVGEATKKKQIFYESKNINPMDSLHPKKNTNLYRQVYKEQISLDDFIKNFKVGPEVIKIDVEGSECNVLKGACRIISEYKPIIFLSIHPKQLSLFNSSIEILKDLIDSLGYIIQDQDGGRTAEFKHKEYLLRPA